MSSWSRLACAAAPAVLLATWSGAAVAGELRHYAIPAGPLSGALAAYSLTSGAQVIAAPGLLVGKRAPEVRGAFDQAEALSRLLAGSGLTAVVGPRGVMMIQTAAAASPGAPPAPDFEPLPVAELVVTAERREGLAIETPIALTRISGRELEALGLSGMDEVSRLAPGLNVAAASPASAGFSMRGITQASGDATREPRLSVFQDGAPASKERGAYFELFDVERIEIAKGPQSTLYGRSAMTGAINVIQRKASLGEAAGRIALTAGDLGLASLDTTLNFPLGDAAALRIAGASRRRDGLVANLLGGPAQQSVATDAARITLRLAPNARANADVILNYERNRPSGAGMKSLTYVPTDPGSGAPIGDLQRRSGASLSALDQNGVTQRLGLERELASATVLARLDLIDDWRLSSLLSSRRFAADERQDADGMSLPVVSLLEQTRGVETNLEARVEYDAGRRWRIFAGFNAFAEHGTQRVPIVVDERLLLARIAGGLTDPAPSLATLTSPAFLAGQVQTLIAHRGGVIDPVQAGAIASRLRSGYLEVNQNFSRTRSLDLFADASFSPLPTWELSAGLRFSRDDKTSGVAPANAEGGSTLGALLAAMATSGEPNRLLLAQLAGETPGGAPPFGLIFHPTAPGGSKVSADLEDSGWSWRLVARHSPTPEFSLYASYARGRRPTVLVAGAPSTPYGPARFGRAPAETVDSLEFGVKAELAGGRLRLDSAIYAYAYEDFQTTRFEGGLLRTVNAGEARAVGGELEARLVLGPGAVATATYGYNRARLAAGAMKGNHFRLAPDHKASIRLDLSRDFAGGSLAFRPSYAWQSEVFFSDDNDVPGLSRALAADLIQDERQGAYGLLDLTLAFTHPNGWTLSGFVRNALDADYIVDAGFIGESYGFSASARGPGRRSGVTLTRRF
ncbi:TonB-dependent receptor [Phenylobacterium sp.]|uniref:TonB-dependent receptor n=1 Tax=Phenylobacterium sp. TaxID=1871053 RepID=UPI00289857A1|nr:TonB-dependent receptor [Phenylobacterium sp.]